MLYSNIISTPAPPLQLSDNIEYAQLILDELKVNQWPVVEESAFKGLLSEELVLDSVGTTLIRDVVAELLPYKVTTSDHYLEAARLMTDRKLDVIGVTTPEGEYLGVIHMRDMLTQLTNLTGTNIPGGLIVLEADPVHFSAGEINRLVETNDAQIRQLNTQIDESTGRFLVTMRINRMEVSDIIATLQRYDYKVTYFVGDEQYENELRRNFHHLLHFIEM